MLTNILDTVSKWRPHHCVHYVGYWGWFRKQPTRRKTKSEMLIVKVKITHWFTEQNQHQHLLIPFTCIQRDGDDDLTAINKNCNHILMKGTEFSIF